MHIDDAINLLIGAINSQFVEASKVDTVTGSSEEDPKSVGNKTSTLAADSIITPRLIIASDGSSRSLAELFPTIKFTGTNDTIAEAALMASDSNDVYLWSVDIVFVTKPLFETNYSDGITGQFDAIWKEYLSSNALSPVKILVAGGPRVGKTTISQDLAAR